MKKKTDSGYDIPKNDLREIQEENAVNETTDDIDSQTGYCRFCGQAGIIETDGSWTQEEVNEAVTCQCRCDMAKRYIESKERKEKANCSRRYRSKTHERHYYRYWTGGKGKGFQNG